MKTIENLRDNVLNMTLENCQNDSAYNDNTLYDFILFGFKGLSNMTEAELLNEFNLLNEGRD